MSFFVGALSDPRLPSRLRRLVFSASTLLPILTVPNLTNQGAAQETNAFAWAQAISGPRQETAESQTQVRLAQSRLAWMREHQPGMWNVAPNEGGFLRDLAVKVNAKRALEIGTSNGYSGIWTALGLRQTGGHLVTLEIDEGRAKLAMENFRAAGVDSLVTLKRTDALQEVSRLDGPFDFVFIDADKQDYVRFLDLVLPKVRAGGVIVAHNVTDLKELLLDYIQAVKTNPQLRTTFENPGPGGFAVSYKLPLR